MSEELMVCELGARVANYAMEYSIDGWDALLDLSAQLYFEKVQN